MSSNEITKSGKDYIGYDYKTVSASNEKTSLYLDAYENFGWVPDDSMPTRQFAGAVTLNFKRDRKILNKAELTRLQQHFEACMDEIASFEKTKTKMATLYSLLVGIIGTGFMAGSVFAVTNVQPMILLCIILGVPGVVGWVLPYFIYRHFARKRIIEIAPLIEQKYDEVHELCEKGNALNH